MIRKFYIRYFHYNKLIIVFDRYWTMSIRGDLNLLFMLIDKNSLIPNYFKMKKLIISKLLKKAKEIVPMIIGVLWLV